MLPLEPDLAAEVSDRTEGNPLFAHQLLADWIARGCLEVGADGFAIREGFEIVIPDDIHELWVARIRRLVDDYPRAERDDVLQAIEIAAALGREVDEGEWRAACERAELDVDERLVDRLNERGLIARTDDGFALAHGLLVDSLERLADEEQRRADHHRQCARMLEKRYPNKSEQTAWRRTLHWRAAGEYDRALEAVDLESKRSRTAGDMERFEDVIACRRELTDRLDLEPTDPRRLETDLWIANLAYATGRLDESVEQLEGLLERCQKAHQWSLAARVYQGLADCLQKQGEQAGAVAHQKRALNLAERAEDDDEAAVARLADQPDRAERAARLAEECAERMK